MTEVTSLVLAESDLGHLFRFNFENCNHLTLQAYSWQVTKPKAFLIALHGIHSHAFFDFLKHNFPQKITNSLTKKEIIDKTYLSYEGSLVQKLNQQNISVFCYDQQGHGSSPKFQNQACYSDTANTYIYDALHFILVVQKMFNTEHKTKMFVAGISFGGLITIKTLELYNYIVTKKKIPEYANYISLLTGERCNYKTSISDKSLSACIDPLLSDEEIIRGCESVHLAGAIVLCPPLQLGNIQNSMPNRIAMYFSGYLSRNWPTSRIVGIQKNPIYPWIQYHKHKPGSLIYLGPASFRMIYEVVCSGKSAQADIDLLIKTDIALYMKYLFLHGVLDDLCDLKTVKDFSEQLKNANIDTQFVEFPNMWHELFVEPGCDGVVDKIVTWLQAKV